MQPLEGARVLVLSADPFAVEPLVAELEEDGVEVVFRVALAALPPADSLDAVVIDRSASAFDPEALWPFLESLPAETLVFDCVPGVRDALRAQLFAPQPAAPIRPLGPRLDTRLSRAALTVLVVTALLWLVGRSQLNRSEDLPPVTPAGPQAGGQAELAGRVTRAGTGEGLAGAAVSASSPSGGSMTTVTDAQGRWRFANLRGGRYVVMSTARGYVARQQQVDVPEGRAVENLNFSLDPEAP